MNSYSVIAKNPELKNSEDYYFLREEGIKHLQQFCGWVWNDHNIHDPGITILEALCYAITDLGYRTKFDVLDLITNENGKLEDGNTLFTCKEILPCNPFTINDYRKLLIDIAGVKNAWLFKGVQEVPIFVDCEKEELTFKSSFGTRNNPEVILNGLYEILLELDDDYPAFHENQIIYDVKAGELKGQSFTIKLNDGWQNIDKGWLVKNAVVTEVTADLTNGKINVVYELDSSLRTAAIQIEVLNVELNAVLKTQLEAELSRKDNYCFINQLKRILIVLFETQKVLHSHRNLCEDFVKIDTVANEEYFICADIDVTQHADIEEVQAQIFYKIEDYLSPDNRFYSLTELMENGIPVESIFNGPVLNNGFIPDEELANSGLRKEIRISDLINLIMDIEEVIAVRDIHLTKYNPEENKWEQIDPNLWRINVTPLHKPTLNTGKCKFNFYKGVLFFTSDKTEVQRELQILIGQNLTPKLSKTPNDLYIENGKYKSTGEYFSVQNDFPIVYGIGEFGVPEETYLTPEDRTARNSKAKQLKAYLIFFEQILANYLAQLSNLNKLYSTETELGKTYFAQTMNDIPGLSDLIKSDIDNNFFEEKNINTDLYEYLIEDEEKYYDRKNRVLDHLMSRFCESFTDYVLIMFDVLGGDAESRADDIVIEDKSDFINSYPKLSSKRGKAFNYFCNNGIWDTDNVSGLEFRLSKLLGFDNAKRKSLFKLPEIISIEEISSGSGLNYKFKIIDEGTTLLTSTKKYVTLDDLNLDAAKVLSLCLYSKNYQVKKSASSDDKFYISVMDENNKALARKNSPFADEASAKAGIEKIIKFITDQLLEDSIEGFHLVEHILLRPVSKKDKLMTVCVDENCEGCDCCNDPYSFRIAIVLPYWTKRFSDMRFRYFVEDMIRYETPAHINARICWVNPQSMLEFENAYHAWLKEKMKCRTDKLKLRKRTFELIEIMETLRSVYPEAYLHDCAESDDETSPVILNQTILGTIKI